MNDCSFNGNTRCSEQDMIEMVKRNNIEIPMQTNKKHIEYIAFYNILWDLGYKPSNNAFAINSDEVVYIKR
ncbi:hypothetical protein [Staphylococcus equorum]|uniref:hypothetical protein n=1 Tax=Staphylococcus equorum TaxID=246432 RepID=UPI003FD8208F